MLTFHYRFAFLCSRFELWSCCQLPHSVPVDLNDTSWLCSVMGTFLLKHSETVPAKTIASSCVRCKEEAWNLCVSGHFVVRDLWKRAGEAWKIMRKALASVRANIAISLFGCWPVGWSFALWHFSGSKIMMWRTKLSCAQNQNRRCEVAPSTGVSLIVAHGTLGRALALSFTSRFCLLVQAYFSKIFHRVFKVQLFSLPSWA